jgi:hypothetical protein
MATPHAVRKEEKKLRLRFIKAVQVPGMENGLARTFREV